MPAIKASTENLALRGLYAITDSSLLPGATLFAAMQAALEGGARIVQYRDKSHDAQRRLHEANTLNTLCRHAGALFLVNDDIALAAAVGAHGVHLGQGDDSIATARAQLGARAIIGVTCHASLTLATAAKAQGASYLAFGAVYASPSKPEAPHASIDVLTQARGLGLPVVAIGGINVDNAPAVITAGADMVAVINALWRDAAPVDQITARAREFSALFLQKSKGLDSNGTDLSSNPLI